MALHLHLLLWIEGSCSPAQLRDRLLMDNDDFRQRLILWLESCHQGEFSTGSMTEVGTHVAHETKKRAQAINVNPTSAVDEIAQQFDVLPGDPTGSLPQPPLTSDNHQILGN